MRRVFCLSSMLCLALASCNTTTVSAVDGLAFGALAGVVPPPAQNIQVIAKITNVTGAVLTVTYDNCALAAVVHSGSASGPIVFDPRPLQNCSAPTTTSLNSTEAVQITASVVPNLPPGTYFVVAMVTVNGTTKAINAGSVTL